MGQYGWLNALQRTKAMSGSSNLCFQIILAESLHTTQEGLAAKVLIVTTEERGNNETMYGDNNTIQH